MADHRVRLTDSDIDLLLSCLRARMPMLRGAKLQRAYRLMERFTDGGSGNPDFRFGRMPLVTAADVFGAARAKRA